MRKLAMWMVPLALVAAALPASAAGLSSRSPLNDAWRNSPAVVKPR